MGSSTITPEVPAEVGGSALVPQEPRGARHCANVPQEPLGVSPSAYEQGVGSKWPRSDEVEQGSGGSSPKHIYRLTLLR